MPHVLIVSLAPTSALANQALLGCQEAGCRTTTVPHGLDVLFTLALKPFDLVMIEAGPSPQAAAALAGIIRERPGNLRLPLLAFGTDWEAGAPQCLEAAGFDACIECPCPDEITEAVLGALRQAPARARPTWGWGPRVDHDAASGLRLPANAPERGLRRGPGAVPFSRGDRHASPWWYHRR